MGCLSYPIDIVSIRLVGGTVVSPNALFELLERSAGIDPDRTAVIEPGQGLITYGELNALANQLRDRLHHQGVCPGDRVGVYLHKSIDSVAAIFGILKSWRCLRSCRSRSSGFQECLYPHRLPGKGRSHRRLLRE